MRFLVHVNIGNEQTDFSDFHVSNTQTSLESTCVTHRIQQRWVVQGFHHHQNWSLKLPQSHSRQPRQERLQNQDPAQVYPDDIVISRSCSRKSACFAAHSAVWLNGLPRRFTPDLSSSHALHPGVGSQPASGLATGPSINQGTNSSRGVTLCPISVSQDVSLPSWP